MTSHTKIVTRRDLSACESNNFNIMNSEMSDVDSPVDDSDIDRDYVPSDAEKVDTNQQVNDFFHLCGMLLYCHC